MMHYKRRTHYNYNYNYFIDVSILVGPFFNQLAAKSPSHTAFKENTKEQEVEARIIRISKRIIIEVDSVALLISVF